MNDGNFPYMVAFRAAAGRDWPPPAGLRPDWLKDLPGGARPPLLNVVAMLAFGRAMAPDGLSDIDAHVECIVAARALLVAAATGKIQIFGLACERLTISSYGGLPLYVRPLDNAVVGRIPQAEFDDGNLALCPLLPNGLSKTAVVARPELWAQPDGWRHAEGISYCGVTIDRERLAKWIGEVTTTKARYATPKTTLAKDAVKECYPNGIPQGMTRGVVYDEIIKQACKITGRKTEIDRKTLKPVVDEFLLTGKFNSPADRR